MLPITLEPTYQLILPAPNETQLFLVGVGGTGSWLALSLARLVYHARAKGTAVALTFIDPDTIEAANVGRQAFAPAEIGHHKAVTMAARLNAALGLDIKAYPDLFKPEIVQHAAQNRYGDRRINQLVIGAVDTPAARQSIRAVLQTGRQANRATYWLDCGNAHDNGQILIGNAIEPAQIRADNALMLIQGAPAPHIQEPGLLAADPAREATLSCADLTVREEQSLIVNQQTAAIASQYAADFVLLNRVGSYATYFSLNPPTTQSRQFTATAVNQIMHSPAYWNSGS